MEHTHKKLFHEVTPPEHVSTRIIERITHLRIRTARIRLALLGGTVIGSLSAIGPAFTYLSQESVRSGFTQYLSLLQSDGDVLLLHWQEFALSLTESLPATGITLLLSAIFVLLWSLPRITTYGRIAFPSSRFVIQ